MKRFAAISAVLGVGGLALAGPVGLGAFGGGTITESFEGLSAGPNALEGSLPGTLRLGSLGSYTFGSGAILVSPGSEAYFDGVLLFDYALGGASTATFSLGRTPGHGYVDSASLVPSGTAYLGRSTKSNTMTFEFASAVDRVGAFVTGSPGIITIEALDAAGTVIDFASLAAVHVSDWGTNFIGVEMAGIKKVRFTGDYAILDHLRWEIDNPIIPLPTGAAMAMVGMGVIGVRRRRG